MTAVILAVALVQAAGFTPPPRPARATNAESAYLGCLFHAVGRAYSELNSGIAPYERAVDACAASRARLREALDKALRKKWGIPDPEVRLGAVDTYLDALDSAFVTHGAVKSRPVEGRQDSLQIAVDSHPRSVAYYQACLRGWAADMDLASRSDAEIATELHDKCLKSRVAATHALTGGDWMGSKYGEAQRKLAKMEEGWFASYRAEQLKRRESAK
jgi:hypothetical protein